MDKWLIRFAVAFLLLLGSAHATSVRDLSVEQFAQAPMVLNVRMLSSETVVVNQMPFQKWTVEVLNSIRGPYASGEKTTLLLPGGDISGKHLRIAGYENFFRVGEEHIVGLEENHMVAGWVTYKISENENGERMAVRKGDTVPLLRSTREARYFGARVEPMSKESLVDQINRSLN